MRKNICGLFLSLLTLTSCATSRPDFTKTVQYVDLKEFMGTWYVIASRPTFLEKGAHNAIEKYAWNEEKSRIDIDFTFNKAAFDGPKKSLPQKAFIFNQKTNAHWKVNPFLWFKFDYLVLAMAPDYKWTVIGVPNQTYIWVMARHSQMKDEDLARILKSVGDLGYNINDVQRVPQAP